MNTIIFVHLHIFKALVLPPQLPCLWVSYEQCLWLPFGRERKKNVNFEDFDLFLLGVFLFLGFRCQLDYAAKVEVSQAR